MLSPKQRYLQIALNSNLEQAKAIINAIPLSRRIIIEAGTPLIKEFGYDAISLLKKWWESKAQELIEEKEEKKEPKSIFGVMGKGVRAYASHTNLPIPYFSDTKIGTEREIKIKKREPFSPYIVADLKCMDRGQREARIAAHYGASATTVLGQAPIETINAFVLECEQLGIDAMIDMMNVDYPLQVLQRLNKRPRVVILHRGVDEERKSEKRIPFHHIQKIKGAYNDVLVAIAGGDSFREVQRAVFNDCDIVVVWKKFYISTTETAQLAQEFLQEIR